MLKIAKTPDLKEFWHVGRVNTTHIASKPNQIMSGRARFPQFQPVMSTLFQQLETCASYLMEACAQYLQQPQRLFNRAGCRRPHYFCAIIHYPPVSADATPTSQRAAPHEDINLITLLCEATTPGLELLSPKGEWLPIQTLPGQIIVDTGDMLQSLSNGLLKSTTHRVVNPNSSRDRRFSMPFFRPSAPRLRPYPAVFLHNPNRRHSAVS